MSTNTTTYLYNIYYLYTNATQTLAYNFQKATSTSTSITYVMIVTCFWFVQTILSDLNFPLCHLHQERGRASVFLWLKCMGVALWGPARELIKSSGWFSPPPHTHTWQPAGDGLLSD